MIFKKANAKWVIPIAPVDRPLVIKRKAEERYLKDIDIGSLTQRIYLLFLNQNPSMLKLISIIRRNKTFQL